MSLIRNLWKCKNKKSLILVVYLCNLLRVIKNSYPYFQFPYLLLQRSLLFNLIKLAASNALMQNAPKT